MDELEVGRVIGLAMRARGWSMHRLAREADVSVNTVRAVLRGGDCRLSTLEMMCEALGVPLERVIAGGRHAV